MKPTSIPLLTPIHPVVAGIPSSVVARAVKCVLVVDDDEDTRGAVAQMVVLAGNGSTPNVMTAASGPEAIEMLAGRFFDLVISDYHMDRMDGVELLRMVQRIEPGVPCILMSGDTAVAENHMRNSPFENTAFLAKPFASEPLNFLLAQALGW